MRKSFLIIDYSSRNVQANLIDIENGQILDTKTNNYTIIHSKPSWSEIDPNEIWLSSQEAVRAIVESTKGKNEIVALGFSWFGDNLILTNSYGDPLDKLLLSFDYRSKNEAQQLIDEYGEEKLISVIGYEPVNSGLIPSKILWFKKNKPEIFSETKLFLNLQQYIISRLGLGVITDFSLACRKNMFDVRNMRWSDSLCNYLKIPVSSLGEETSAANSIIGSIDHFGEVDLSKEIPVLLGAHNSISGMIGMGSLPDDPPVLTELIGTFDSIGHLTNTYYENYTGFLACYCGPFKDSYVVTGSSIAQPDIEWAVKVLFPSESLSTITNLLKQCPMDGRNRVILSKGIQTSDGLIRGINLTTSKLDILQAIVEGVTYPLIGIINQISRINQTNFSSIRCGGRGAAIDFYLQMKADMFDLKVEKASNTYATSLGAAIMLAVELGYWPDYKTAINNMVNMDKTFEPRQEISQRYKQRYLEYLEISA